MNNEKSGGWFRSNNPLYLLSVVLMLLGLYLVGSELESGKVSILTVAGFFAVQNLYEILMIVLVLYLLKNQIQSDMASFCSFLSWFSWRPDFLSR